MTAELAIRAMTRSEAFDLVAMAAAEGWNPGLHDADAFWACDPDAFIAAELDDEVIGGGAITAYGEAYGFMGLFIIKPDFRGQGLGSRLWQARRDRLIGRLKPGATIGMDGVFEMADWYARGGFVLSHRNLRYRMDVPVGFSADASPAVVPLDTLPFDAIEAYDRQCFPGPRQPFLKAWLSNPESAALGLVRDGQLAGYGVVRRCGEGCKIGPLFADDENVAEALFQSLAAYAAGGPLFLDAAENHEAVQALVLRHGLQAVFGCARMYLGPIPGIAHEKVFGVTTFELG